VKQDWLYLERDEVWYRNIPTQILENSPGAEYDYQKRGYWIDPRHPLALHLEQEHCRFLKDWTQAKY
jgi:hypothetical protein